jgi:hypothetical protein
MVSSDKDVLSFCNCCNNHHIGTLQCRREGASTPSTEPRDIGAQNQLKRAIECPAGKTRVKKPDEIDGPPK